MSINKIVEKVTKLENELNQWKNVKKQAEVNIKIIEGNVAKLSNINIITPKELIETYDIMKLGEQEKIDEAIEKMEGIRLNLRNIKSDERKAKRMIEKLSNMGVEIVNQ